jgi:hypothetical protein
MMENHSFDNYLGALGRREGFKLGGMGRREDGRLRHSDSSRGAWRRQVSGDGYWAETNFIPMAETSQLSGDPPGTSAAASGITSSRSAVRFAAGDR